MKSNTEQLAIAKKYVGYGGSKFRKFCGLPSGSAWCDAYVTTIFAEAGNASLFCNGTKQTYCPTTIKWCLKNLASVPPFLALPSDIIFFDWELNGVPNHIGFVRERKDCDTIYTIEGNTSGSICAQKTRNTKYVQGIFRPHFKASYKIAKLDVDGLFGYNSIAMLQKALGVTVDGVLGQGTVKALQSKAGVSADGLWGKGTSKAVQKMVGVTADGLFGVNSVKALQKWINNKVCPQSVTPTTTTTTKYSGTIPSIHVTKSVQQVINDSIKWGKWIASDNSFHYGYGKDAHHNGCYFCGTQPASKRKSGIKDWQKTYCCNPFVHACFAHGGLVTAMLSLCEKGKSYGFAKSEGYAKSAYFKAMGKLSASKLVAGDVLCSDSHVALYIGSGKVVQASGGDNNVPYSTSWNKSISVGTWGGYTRVYRLIKGVNADVAIRFGEYSDRVKQLQQFLNWYNGKNVCNVDGIFGEGTLKYVKAFQTAQKIAVDGIVGNGTISKMKSATKSTPTVSPSTTWVDKANAWARKISAEKYHYVRWKSGVTATHTCPICTGRKYDNYYGWNCIGFAYAVWHHGGQLGTTCNCGVINNGTAEKLLKVSQTEANKLATSKIGKSVTVIRNGGKAIPMTTLKAGDICMLYKGSTYYHTIYYMGNGKFAESNTTGGVGSAKNIRADLTLSSSYKANLKCAIRYTGK